MAGDISPVPWPQGGTILWYNYILELFLRSDWVGDFIWDGRLASFLIQFHVTITVLVSHGNIFLINHLHWIIGTGFNFGRTQTNTLVKHVTQSCLFLIFKQGP